MINLEKSESNLLPLKIWFADFWPGFDPECNFIINLLKNKYHGVLDPNPECLIYSSFGDAYNDFDCLRVYYTGENIRPDYRVCDYAFTYDHDESSRHIRWPMFVLYGMLMKSLEVLRDVEKIVQAFASNCIPIYWGNPRVNEDFNSAVFINRHDFQSEEEMVEKIIMVDRNEEMYRSYLTQPVFGPDQANWRTHTIRVLEQFNRIFTDAKAGILHRAESLG